VSASATEQEKRLEGKWIATEIAEATLPHGTRVTFDFADGQLIGDSGCNIFKTFYTVNGSSLLLGPIEIRGETCGEEAMNLESALLRALQRTSDFIIDANGRLILDGFGTPMVTAVPRTD